MLNAQITSNDLEDVNIRGDKPPAGRLGLDEPLDEGQEAEGDHAEDQDKEQHQQPVQGHSEI